VRTTIGLFAAAALAGGGLACGDDEGGSGRSDRVVVSAATSLETAFTAYADEAGIEANQSFAGSDQLAAQIRQGLRPDVYAAANASLPNELFAEGLVERPVVFATNSLVIGVPADSPIGTIEDVGEPGTKVAVGDPSVPVGAYTREVLGRLPPGQGAGILHNVATEEPDASGIVGKLVQGAVDAGFVYVTDVEAADSGLRAIALPPAVEPEIAYAVAPVAGADNPEAAAAFIRGLLEGDGREALDAAGFGTPSSG
jgi:molybdate transport system substrate-binding protein